MVEVKLKTEKSVRSLALSTMLVGLLRQHRARQQQKRQMFGLRWNPDA